MIKRWYQSDKKHCFKAKLSIINVRGNVFWSKLHLCPILLTWFNFNPSMDKESHALLSVGWNYLSIPKLQRCNRWNLGMDKQLHPTFYNGCNYLSMLGLKLNHVSKIGPSMLIFFGKDECRRTGYTCNILMSIRFQLAVNCMAAINSQTAVGIFTCPRRQNGLFWTPSVSWHYIDSLRLNGIYIRRWTG